MIAFCIPSVSPSTPAGRSCFDTEKTSTYVTSPGASARSSARSYGMRRMRASPKVDKSAASGADESIPSVARSVCLSRTVSVVPVRRDHIGIHRSSATELPISPGRLSFPHDARRSAQQARAPTATRAASHVPAAVQLSPRREQKQHASSKRCASCWQLQCTLLTQRPCCPQQNGSSALQAG